MTPSEVKELFVTGYRFHKETGMSANTLHNWIKSGYVPFKAQKKLESITDGDLVAQWDEKEVYSSPIKKSHLD